MTDEKTAPKTTPESTKRFRLTIAALKNVEDAEDRQVRSLIGEFQTFFQLYVDQRLREVESREPLPFAGVPSGATGLSNRLTEGSGGPVAQQSLIGKATTPTTNWGDQRIK